MFFIPTFKSWCFGISMSWEGKVIAAPAANDDGWDG